ncbi:MAG: hypothetical protein BJ554DRAFT_7874, partial [Olpidium bornovanus]
MALAGISSPYGALWPPRPSLSLHLTSAAQRKAREGTRSPLPLVDKKKEGRFRQGEANPFIHYAGVAASGHGKPLHQGEELFDLQNIKEQWVRKELEERENQFSEYHEVTILIGTWNVNSRLPSESLKPWLECDGDPELIAIGFQELDLSAEAFLVTDTYREVEWTKMIISGIEASHAARYTKVASKQLVGMLLIVLVRNDCLEHITGVAADYAGCGIMGM